MHEMSLVTVKVEPRSTSRLSSAWEGGGNAKESLQILDFQRLVHQNPTRSVSISIAALIYKEIMSHLTVNLKKLKRTSLSEITTSN